MDIGTVQAIFAALIASEAGVAGLLRTGLVRGWMGFLLQLGIALAAFIVGEELLGWRREEVAIALGAAVVGGLMIPGFFRGLACRLDRLAAWFAPWILGGFFLWVLIHGMEPAQAGQILGQLIVIGIIAYAIRFMVLAPFRRKKKNKKS